MIFDGKRSKDFGLYISGSGVFNAPERDVEVVEVPGRNGALVLDNGRFRNITVSYPAYISRAFPQYAAAVRNWLCSRNSYFRLEDTYHPDYFRMARFSGPMDFETRFLNFGAETNLFFDCKPQRFLKMGELPIATESKTVSFVNPTSFPALPLIKVYGSGSGTLTCNDAEISISNIDGYVVLDSELQDAYKDGISKNASVSLTTFPVFEEGTTTIDISENITKIEITPRWWTI